MKVKGFKMSEKKRRFIAIGIMAVGVVFIGLGIIRGENTAIWRKAVNICLECIGLG